MFSSEFLRYFLPSAVFFTSSWLASSEVVTRTGGALTLQNGWASILQAKLPLHFVRRVVMLLVK